MVSIMTYAMFGFIHQTKPLFFQNLKYIVCDEIHNLPRFEDFDKKPNLHTYAREAIESAVKYPGTFVIGMTATPSMAKKLLKTAFYDVPINQKNIIRYETKERIPFYDSSMVFRMEAGTGMCFTPRITTMLGIEEQAKASGLHPICIWSINNKDHPMTEEQLKVRESILTGGKIPPEYDLLIINSSSETSLKIVSPVDYVIINHSDADIQTQVRGRVNHDLDRLYLPGAIDEVHISIPTEYLGVRLFKEDKDRLCKVLNLRRKENGVLIGWNTVKELLIDNGYVISDGNREKGKRYSVITAT